MIRILTEQDRQQVMEFLSDKPAENLFMIGDIEQYGFEQSIQTLWGDFREDGRLAAVLLKYTDNYILYAPGEFDGQGIAGIINQDSDFRFISGLESIICRLEPFLTAKSSNQRVLHYAKCERTDLLPDVPEEIEVQSAVPDDAERIVRMLQQVPEFSDSTYDVDRNREKLQNGGGRTKFIEENGIIVSSASSTAENSQSAMIVGVATLPAHQKKRLATYCMSVICRELLDEGKMLCLFYDNPEAGKIYKRIGFEDIDKWCMWTYN